MNHSHAGAVRGVPLIGMVMYLLMTAISVQAETTNCTAITSLPALITVQGVYCFTGNLSTSMTSGNAIEIQTNNVTLDLNGFKLGGLGAGDGTQAFGIYASQRKNITIKNGIVRGFLFGIRLNDGFPFTTSSGHVVKNILADQNTLVGIRVEGFGSTVSKNRVVDTGGSTLTSSLEAVGLAVLGSGTKVIDNTVSTTSTTGTDVAVGMYLENADSSLVQNNTVTDTLRETGPSYAIRIHNSPGVFLSNNNLVNAEYGLYFSNSNGKYFNNLTVNVITPFTGGMPVGSNND